MKASRARSLRTWPARSRIHIQADGPVADPGPSSSPLPASGSSTPPLLNTGGGGDQTPPSFQPELLRLVRHVLRAEDSPALKPRSRDPVDLPAHDRVVGAPQRPRLDLWSVAGASL